VAHRTRWLPAESYGSPEQWFAQTTEIEDGIRVAALGPYPSRGDYEHCFPLESASGEFIPLSPAACDGIVARSIGHGGRGARKCATRETRRARHVDLGMDDNLDDAVPAFHGQPFVVGAQKLLGGAD
jgi:hypothetical protein